MSFLRLRNEGLMRMTGFENEMNSDQGHGKPEALKQATRERAYKLWAAEGSPEGRLDEYWHRAQELIEDESKSAYPPAQSRGNRT